MNPTPKEVFDAMQRYAIRYRDSDRSEVAYHTFRLSNYHITQGDLKQAEEAQHADLVKVPINVHDEPLYMLRKTLWDVKISAMTDLEDKQHQPEPQPLFATEPLDSLWRAILG